MFMLPWYGASSKNWLIFLESVCKMNSNSWHAESNLIWEVSFSKQSFLSVLVCWRSRLFQLQTVLPFKNHKLLEHFGSGYMVWSTFTRRGNSSISQSGYFCTCMQNCQKWRPWRFAERIDWGSIPRTSMCFDTSIGNSRIYQRRGERITGRTGWH